mmetsp:Transcript_22104/g.44149  ORF Transcript_22104/g.44149 Transcript_22104/m.44149 type:complete len:322 (+) Transcript_22104:505-1470(+)
MVLFLLLLAAAIFVLGLLVLLLVASIVSPSLLRIKAGPVAPPLFRLLERLPGPPLELLHLGPEPAFGAVVHGRSEGRSGGLGRGGGSHLDGGRVWLHSVGADLGSRAVVIDDPAFYHRGLPSGRLSPPPPPLHPPLDFPLGFFHRPFPCLLLLGGASAVVLPQGPLEPGHLSPPLPPLLLDSFGPLLPHPLDFTLELLNFLGPRRPNPLAVVEAVLEPPNVALESCHLLLIFVLHGHDGGLEPVNGPHVFLDVSGLVASPRTGYYGRLPVASAHGAQLAHLVGPPSLLLLEVFSHPLAVLLALPPHVVGLLLGPVPNCRER